MFLQILWFDYFTVHSGLSLTHLPCSSASPLPLGPSSWTHVLCFTWALWGSAGRMLDWRRLGSWMLFLNGTAAPYGALEPIKRKGNALQACFTLPSSHFFPLSSSPSSLSLPFPLPHPLTLSHLSFSFSSLFEVGINFCVPHPLVINCSKEGNRGFLSQQSWDRQMEGLQRWVRGKRGKRVKDFDLLEVKATPRLKIYWLLYWEELLKSILPLTPLVTKGLRRLFTTHTLSSVVCQVNTQILIVPLKCREVLYLIRKPTQIPIYRKQQCVLETL